MTTFIYALLNPRKTRELQSNGLVRAGLARMSWAIIPADLKQGIIRLERSGRMTEATADVLRDAEQILKRYPSTSMNLCFAINEAAEKWLERHSKPPNART